MLPWCLDLGVLNSGPLSKASHSHDKAVGIPVQKYNLAGFNLPAFFLDTT